MTVLDSTGGWLHVMLKDKPEVTGYVSQELVKYVSPGQVSTDKGNTVVGDVITVAKAFVILKQAETRKAQDPKYTPTKGEKEWIKRAIEQLENSQKYTVDHSTYQVTFKHKQGEKTKVTTIEDFILFVETVERAHPTARPAEVASEIRQIWFSDTNWEVLVASQGIQEKTAGGETKQVDIESEPDAIAVAFDMKDLAPKSGGKKIATRMGVVDIGHVMAGIDATLSGSPKDYPKDFLKSQGHDDETARLKYKTLQAASGGKVRDFATWAGDLGQAYAEYLADRWLKKNGSAKLAAFVSQKTSDDQLLGDIHGYVAVEVWKKVAGKRPDGDKLSVSAILRDLYLVDKKESGVEQSYAPHFEEASGKKSDQWQAFIAERAGRFARPWYAKKAYEHKGYLSSTGWGKEAILDNWQADYDKMHARNEAQAPVEDKLDGICNKFLERLKEKMP